MSKRLTIDNFIKRSTETHGHYDYSKVEYINNSTKVCIVCYEHGDFWQTPNTHLGGSGCPKCGSIIAGYKKTKGILKTRYEGLIQPEEYKLIPLTKGKFTKVDNEDFDRVKDICWKYSNGYAYHNDKGKMHRFILGAEKGEIVDHIYGDKLDNRKSMLRICSNSENIFNANQRGGMSKYKGVSQRKDNGKWRMSITKNYKVYSKSTFKTEEDAAMAYDRKAIELFGEFAYQTLNFPNLLNEYLKELNDV